MARRKATRKSRSVYTTRGGNSIKLNSSLTDRRKQRKQEKATKKALYLSTLPKNRWKRWQHRLSPRHLYEYWFSRDGAVMALRIIGISIVAGFLLLIGLFAYFRKDLPQIKDIAGDNLGGTVSYYDRTGQTLLFQDNNGIKRTPVQSNQISTYMKEATVAVEDKNFYKEGAFDVRGIIRAAYNDAFGGGGGLQGGSTITQQLVKLNENWTNDRTITRKVKELILAVEVEREYSKDDILTGYLNLAPYGGVDYGVESASMDYFRVHAANLTLAQATFLAAIPKSPGVYSPYNSSKYNPAAGNTFDEEGLLSRQQYILKQMVAQGYITQAQANQASSVNVLATVQPAEDNYGSLQAPYFVLRAKAQLQSQLGAQLATRGGLKVITTLNMTLQSYAEQDVQKNIPNIKTSGADEEATVGEDVKTGQVVMMVGGTNYNDPDHGQINYADTNILPGSSVKPFVYSSLIENNTNVGAGSVLYDIQQPITAGGTSYYPCTNKARPIDGGNCLFDYDFNYPGPLSIRYALAGSRNVPAIKAALSVIPNDNSSGHTKSVDKYIDTFNALTGYDNAIKCFAPGTNTFNATSKDISQCYASSGIGDGAYIKIDDQVNGDASLARLGQVIPQTYILQVKNDSNKTLYQWTQAKAKQIIRPDSAYIVDNILSDPRATYLSGNYKFQNWNGWDTAVKTGTQNNNYDGLMTAWNTQFAIVSWVGYHTGNKSLLPGHMENNTAPLTETWMKQALGSLNTKASNWTAPTDLKHVNAYVQRSHVGLGSIEPGPTSELFPSWYVAKGSNSGSATIDKVSGLLATNCTPSSAQESVGGANSGSFSVDIFYPKYVSNEQVLEGGPIASNSVTGSDNIHKCSDNPPSISLTVTDSTGTNNTCTGTCTITVNATSGTWPLSGGNYTIDPAATIDVKVNGSVVKSITIPPDQSQSFNSSFTYSSTLSSNATVQATIYDSVLYSASQSQSVNFTDNLSNFQSTNNNDGTFTFSWTGGTAPYTVSSGGSTVCQTSGTSCSGTMTTGQNVTLSDGSGNSQTLST